MIYYQEVEIEEHMLFAKEIATLHNITPQKVSSLIRVYIKKHNIQSPKLFYKTRYGLSRVYPKSIWGKVFIDEN